jgi:GNAT superfamily N-acetyltransferase
MNSMHSTPGSDEPAAVITQVAEGQWHAVADDRVVGRGDASPRPDGRMFLSIDAWRGVVFDQLADTMLASLPTPLYTVVDEADDELTSSWERVGFKTRRREWEYLVPTDPHATGLGSVQPPPGVTIVPAGEAHEGRLRELDRAIRDEVEAGAGWQAMPAEILSRPDGPTSLDLPKFVVAAQADRYVGLVRLGPLRRQPRIGLLAVRADLHRRGVARALLAHVLGSLYRSGTESAWAEVNESNGAATALFEGLGARRASSNLELVRS